jgi:hypothetical protein
VLLRPEAVWPVDDEYGELYLQMTSAGREAARHGEAVIVGIARNAMPHIENTLALLAEAVPQFRSCRMYVYENDSTDGTAECLDAFAASNGWFTVEHDTLGGVDARGFEPERTHRLAACRNKCLEWVRANAPQATWVIVVDLDPHGGFSVDGIYNSIGWLTSKSTEPAVRRPGGMASFSLWAEQREEGQPPHIAQYDSWAARPNWWRDRREEIGFAWFSMLLFPVGAPPVAMNSAFGGLCVYAAEAILAPGVRYEGGDCEHVLLHRHMHAAGHQLYLNPGSRYIAHWK